MVLVYQKRRPLGKKHRKNFSAAGRVFRQRIPYNDSATLLEILIAGGMTHGGQAGAVPGVQGGRRRRANISLAAKNLYISQSAVSQSIKQLETALQARLFARSPRGVSLTWEGQVTGALPVRPQRPGPAGHRERTSCPRPSSCCWGR